MNEKEKMIAGLLYDSGDPELVAMRGKAHRLCKEYNDTPEEEAERRMTIMRELFPEMGEGCYIQGPMQVDYGAFVKMGQNVYANFNLVILDICPVTLGDNVFMGPNVSLLTPLHPFLPRERNQRKRKNGDAYDYEYGKPIVIDADCWISGNVTVIGGVHIGRGCVIGAGSVVTKDIPPHSLAVGNPCRVIRQITEADALTDYFDAEGNWIVR